MVRKGEPGQRLISVNKFLRLQTGFTFLELSNSPQFSWKLVTRPQGRKAWPDRALAQRGRNQAYEKRKKGNQMHTSRSTHRILTTQYIRNLNKLPVGSGHQLRRLKGLGSPRPHASQIAYSGLELPHKTTADLPSRAR